MGTLSEAEVIVDADGNTHVIIKGGASNNQREVRDESDYYLHMKPLQDRGNAQCQFVESDLAIVERDRIEVAIIQGQTLINDIKITQIKDQRLKLFLERRADECQLKLLAEKRRRQVENYDYAIQQAGEYQRKADELRRQVERNNQRLRDLGL